MQILFLDESGKRQVLNSQGAEAAARLIAAKAAAGWTVAPENPPAVHLLANLPESGTATSGLFLDPSGLTMRLTATTHAEFRVLVTRKLAAGWKRLPTSPKAEPLKNETEVALPPPQLPTPRVTVTLPPPPPVEEREAAIAEAQERAPSRKRKPSSDE